MKLQLESGYSLAEGGVCAASGFSANGCHCGLDPNPDKNYLGIIYSEKLCHAPAVYP